MRRVPPERFALDLELFDEADFLWLEPEVELELDESSEDIVTRPGVEAAYRVCLETRPRRRKLRWLHSLTVYIVVQPTHRGER